MTEEFLVLGRPPRPPRRGRWASRGPKLVLGAVLLVLAGWAVWHGVLDDSPATPRRPATPGAGSTGFVAHEPPRVAYLRSGVMVRPDDLPRGIPDGSWTDFALLEDGRVVLVQRGSLTVLSPDLPPRHYDHVGGITARPDQTAVAWTDPAGRVRELAVGHLDAAVVRGARQLSPTCRGLRVAGRDAAGWQTCDRDGGLISPDGRYFVSVGRDTLTIAPRADITAGVSAELRGAVLDAVWEDDDHLLVVTERDQETHLLRIWAGGATEDLITPVRGAGDRGRPALVLPATGGQTTQTPAVQP